MRSLLALLFLPLLLSAEERWVELKSGPFHVLSSAGDKAAREQMMQLEQFRHVLGSALGRPDAVLVWPLEVLVFKGSGPASHIALARDHYVTTSANPNLLRELARILIDQNTSRLPADIENGLIDLFSTVEVSGTHVTLGAPPATKNRPWARMHLLNVDANYAGRTRVMISNLEQMPDLDVAYRNAFGKSAVEIEKQVDAYFAAGQYGTTNLSARAISAVRDFHVTSADADTVQLALADFKGTYDSLHGAEASEGLGLQSLKANQQKEAKRLFDSACQSGSKSGRAWFEAGVLDTEPANARKLLTKAAELNPRWSEPHYRMALLEKDLDRKAALLKKATALDPRNSEYWQALAKNETEAARFIDAQKAWAGAEKAALNPKERERIRQVRLGLQAERADHEAAEKRRKAEEEARDLERVKNQSLAEIHAAETAAVKKANPDGAAVPKAMDWYSASDSGTKVDGLFQRFDCLGKQGRVVLQTGDGKTVQLLVRDPGQIVLSGSGEMTLGCGVQKPARKVQVVYNPKQDKRLGTAGEVASIEFR